MIDRYATLQLEILKSETLPTGSRSLAKLCQDWGLGKQPQECLWVIAYDLNGHLRTVIEVARGTHAEMHVGIPEVMTAVLSTSAYAFSIAHNHPTVGLLPSTSDVDLTNKIMAAANTVGLLFEEHVIVGPTDQYYSFVDAGLLIPAPRGGGKVAKAASKRSGGR